MNKYQEALDRAVKDIEYHYADWGNDIPSERLEEIKLLQELVDKATPKKVSPKWREGYDPKLYYPKSFYCPSCSRQLRRDQSYKCCPKCGQALDWSYK